MSFMGLPYYEMIVVYDYEFETILCFVFDLIIIIDTAAQQSSFLSL
jgi:hypothetical protein